MLHLIAALLPLLAQKPPTPPQNPPIPADTEIVTTASGLKYSVLVPGDGGAHPKKGDHARMSYTGWTTDGTVFDSSVLKGAPPYDFDVGVGAVIKGWDEAVQLMSKGEKLKLTIPPDLAYGNRGQGKIPANATLIFEVELVDFTAVPEFKPGNKGAQKKTDSGMLCEIIKPATGVAPAADDVLSIKYAFWTAEGRLLQCTEREDRGQLLVSTVDKLPVPIFREGAKLLHVGERLRIEAPAKVAFGDRLQPGMSPDALTVWELELVALKKPLPVPPFSATPADKLIKTPSGLGYEVIREGTGNVPKLGQELTLHYAGWFVDGKPFDSSYSRAEPMTLRLPGRVIKGWNEGLQLMKAGAIYKFTIPPELAYGKPGSPPDIPPDATLIFYIELISIAN